MRKNPLLLRLPEHVLSWKGPPAGLLVSPPGCVGRASRGKAEPLVAFKRVRLYLSQHKSSHYIWQDLSLVANGKGFRNNVPALDRPVRASELRCMGPGGGDHCGKSRYLKAVMWSSAALPRSWESAIRQSERSRRPGLSWKGFRDSGTAQQGLGIQGLLGNSPEQSPHTLRSADLRGKGLESTLGLKVQRWTVRQDESNQPLIPVGLEPGLARLLRAWPPVLEPRHQGSHCPRWALLGLPPSNTEGSHAWMRVS